MRPFDDEETCWEYQMPSQIPKEGTQEPSAALAPDLSVPSERWAAPTATTGAAATAHAVGVVSEAGRGRRSGRRARWPLVGAIALLLALLLGALASVSANVGAHLLEMTQGRPMPAPTASASPAGPPRSTPTGTGPAALTAPATTSSVPPTAGSPLLAQDRFDRADQPGWGQASDGQVWGADAQGGAFAIARGAGVIAVGTASFENAVLGPVCADGTVSLSGSLSQYRLDAGVNLGVVARWQNGLTFEKAYLDGRQFVLVQRVAGRQFVLSARPFVAQEGVSYTLRLQAIGTRVWAKAWATAEREPATFQLQGEDRSLAGGRMGLRVLLRPGVKARITAFTARSLPASPSAVTTIPSLQTAAFA